MATQYQIKVLENKLSLMDKDSKEYFILANKIKTLKKTIQKDIKNKPWNDYLSK